MARGMICHRGTALTIHESAITESYCLRRCPAWASRR